MTHYFSIWKTVILELQLIINLFLITPNPFIGIVFPEIVLFVLYIYVCKVFYVSDFISKDDFIFQGTNEINEKLWKTMNADRRIHMVPLKINGIYFL